MQAGECIILETLFRGIGSAGIHSACNSISLRIWSLLFPFVFAYPVTQLAGKVIFSDC